MRPKRREQAWYVSDDDPAPRAQMVFLDTEMSNIPTVRLDKKLGLQMEKIRTPTHPLLTWWIEHTAALLALVRKGQDGFTPSHRLRGGP